MTFRLAIGQVNPTAGDLVLNSRLVQEGIRKAADARADLVIFPELVICGYPPEDLLIRPSFISGCRETLEVIAGETAEVTAIVGAPVIWDGALRNAAVVLAGGKVAGLVSKTELPNYGVFDEKRYFSPGANGPLVRIGAMTIGVTICEDIWVESGLLDSQVSDGANLLVNISGSPYREGVFEFRREKAASAAKRLGVPFAYCNIVGGQDELIFDGKSFVLDHEGNTVAVMESFAEDFMTIDFPLPGKGRKVARETITATAPSGKKPPAVEKRRKVIDDPDGEVYEALVLGTRDYVQKNGFPGVAVALSGGIDSALTCAIAVDALGADRVSGYLMPSPYSSRGSVEDAQKLADNMGIKTAALPIGEAMEVFDSALANVFAGKKPDVTEENIQARIRGNLMMAISNKMRLLVLTTGNKSETAMGYCTLYGDMAGGLAVIKDLYKVKVYSLARWRNKKAERDLIPRETINKEPSAELRPNQKDTDSLPPYEVLDPILREYIEQDRSTGEIIAMGHDPEIVRRVIRLVDLNEYKRRQGPIGLKITAKAFGRDRRLPITCKYREE
ncbi:MAG: NAD+ synthase [Nitrospinota bacterium]|nr:NAD+ synthase [Nitrospinota bacterium]